MGAMANIPLPGAAMIRQSSGEQAAIHIRRLIFDGELRPGDRVPQDEIAHTLGISRIPVREALIALEREGWVTIEMHRGAFISAIDAQAVRDHYELYGLVYGFAARRALARRDPDLVDHLGAIERRLVDTDEPQEMGRLSVEFQAAVVDAAHSPRIKVVLRAMSALVPGDFFAEVPGAMDVQRRGLPAVLRAMRRGDGDRAADEYLRLMRRMGDKVVQLFKERNLFDPSDAAA
jgi:DNA-binding GntR family transcriptional regulator